MSGLLFPLIGALSNWLLRGGGLEPLIGRNIPGGKILNAILYGVCFALATEEWWMAFIAAGLMAIGQAPAWGSYIKRIMDGDWVGILQLSIRGAFWGGCLALAGVPIDNGLYAILCILAGLTMGPVYWLMWTFVGHRNSAVFNHWTCSEMLFGFLLWWPLELISWA